MFPRMISLLLIMQLLVIIFGETPHGSPHSAAAFPSDAQ